MFDPPKQPEPLITIFSSSEAEPDPAVEFRSNLDQLTPHTLIAHSIMVINVAVFLLMACSQMNFLDFDIKTLIAWGADYGPLTATSGQWWRLLTSTFLHAGIIHLAFNMFVLFRIGPFMEQLVGRFGFLVVYIFSGLGGSFASVAYNPFGVSVGASGAIFGLYGALLGFILLRRDTIPAVILGRLKQAGIVFLGYNLVYGFVNEGTDVAAHLGGLVTGFLSGVVLSSPLTIEMARRRQHRAAALAAVFFVALVPAAGALPRPADFFAELDRLGKVEHQCVTALNSALERGRSGEQSNLATAEFVERDVVKPWSAERDTLVGIERQMRPGPQRRVLNRLLDYVNARQEAWSLTAQGFRTGNLQLLHDAARKQIYAATLARRVAK